MSSLLVATICPGRVVSEGYFHSTLSAISLLQTKGHHLEIKTFPNDILVPRTRNNAIAYFLSTKHDKLMFIDADISYPPQALLDLLEGNKEICGVPYAGTSRDWDQALKITKKMLSEGKDIKAKDLMQSTLHFNLNQKAKESTAEERESGWVEVNALAAGFMMLDRRALQKMIDHYKADLEYKNMSKAYASSTPQEFCVALFDTTIDPETKTYLSDDVAFCRRAKAIGVKIFAYIKPRLKRAGNTDF